MYRMQKKSTAIDLHHCCTVILNREGKTCIHALSAEECKNWIDSDMKFNPVSDINKYSATLSNNGRMLLFNGQSLQRTV